MFYPAYPRNTTFFSKIEGNIPNPKQEISKTSYYAVLAYDYFDNPHIITVEQPTDSSYQLAYYKNVNGDWEKEVIDENPEAFYAPVMIRGDSALLLIYGKADTIEYAVNKHHTMIQFRKLDIPLVVHNKQNNASISSFPNPFTSNVVIKIASPDQQKISFQVFQLNGQCVYHSSVFQTNGYDCELDWDGSNDEGTCLPPGIYFAKILLNNTVRCCKLIKQ
jgi:hypothetical protein